MRRKFYSLKKLRIRQSWHKNNLYNLHLQRAPSTHTATYFQQKWTAKSLSRAYHGEQVREKQWQRLFRSRLSSVVSMDQRYLASNDGSEQGAGRGSGVESGGSMGHQYPKTPYMNMVYAPLERRLDTAIFRALFASSARQARQFVVHGAVKVNGKKMIYPGYLLNPGDMFQVEPERVLFATGARKNSAERRAGRRGERASNSVESSQTDMNAKDAEPPQPLKSVTLPTRPDEDPKKSLLNLMNQAKSIIEVSKENLPAKRKQQLRAFSRSVQRALSRHSLSSSSSIETQISTLTSLLEPSSLQAAEVKPKAPRSRPSADTVALRKALEEMRDNPIDSRKPYATPWRPREYMSAFAFIPRYLEVNHRICSAVYIRHPVARPGLAEVPSPFHTETNQLAFNWYLRRR
ncbi:MAG: mitochondrial 37S ribosomal protein nam9 [Trizodia sp. TS-e1964]|nr:MAG: mitochondrial 37S ribosomal protein nam9 [Trizodia sp. TS-e1964]